MRKIYDLREERKKRGLSLREIARQAGVNYVQVWQLERGYLDGVSAVVKAKVAGVLKIEMCRLFPGEVAAVQNVVRGLEEYGRHWLLLTLLDFCPNLHFKDYADEAKTVVVLKKMDKEELGALFHSGLTENEAWDHIVHAAKRCRLPIPERA